jgi:phosphoserine phosphatase RsbU/P
MESTQKISDDVLNNLNELIQAFTCSLDIDETLAVTLEQLLIHLQTEAASVFLLDDASQQLNCHACVGPVDVKGINIKVGNGIVGKAVAEGQIQLVRDTKSSEIFSPEIDRRSGFSTRSILCAPLIVQGNTLGAIELINKIPSEHNLEGLFNSTDEQLLGILASSAALAIHNARMAEKLVKSEKIIQELGIARTIQESFLPIFDDQTPIMGINLAAKNVSGDFFDYMLLPDGNYIFNIGDVSGKGMDAALLMAKGCGLYRCLAKTITSPAQIMQIINHELCAQSTRGMFITMIGGVYDPKAGTITMANAGHLPAIQHTADGDFISHESLSLPLGILGDQVFEESTFTLADSNLYLYTDGLSEGLARVLKKPDELENLQVLIEQHSDRPGPQRLDLFAQQASELDSNFDDLTILLVEGGKQFV